MKHEKTPTEPTEHSDPTEDLDGRLLDDNDIPTLEERLADADHGFEEESAIPTSQFDLDDDSEADRPAADAIHTLPLDERVMDEDIDPVRREQEIATLEAIVFDGADPKQVKKAGQTLTGEQKAAKPAAPSPEAIIPQEKLTPMMPELPGNPKPLPKISNNPFLPQHILDRLNQGKRNLVEEIAQSGAALDASTAMLRTRARADRQQRSLYGEPQPTTTNPPRDRVSTRKQQLVDDLVEEYLPLLASELRKRLKKMLDEQD